VGRLYAIETKVRDWQRAVRQARIYALWCDSYVIVMPRISRGSLQQMVAAVAADRAGLVVDRKWVRRPRLARTSSAHRLWGSEHVVAAFGG
jgi:hypothetical protein